MSEQPDFVTNSRDTAFARFYTKAVQNNFLSEREARPIFENHEFVEITFPADRRTIVDRRVKGEDKQRWPRQYAAFRSDQDQISDGMPLDQYAGLTAADVEELKFFKVRTVEQLAGLTDQNLSDMPPGVRKFRDAAARYLSQAAGNAPVEKLAAEVAQRDDTIAAMQEQMASMRKQIEELQKKPARETAK